MGLLRRGLHGQVEPGELGGVAVGEDADTGAVRGHRQPGLQHSSPAAPGSSTCWSHRAHAWPSPGGNQGWSTGVASDNTLDRACRASVAAPSPARKLPSRVHGISPRDRGCVDGGDLRAPYLWTAGVSSEIRTAMTAMTTRPRPRCGLQFEFERRRGSPCTVADSTNGCPTRLGSFRRCTTPPSQYWLPLR